MTGKIKQIRFLPKGKFVYQITLLDIPVTGLKLLGFWKRY